MVPRLIKVMPNDNRRYYIPGRVGGCVVLSCHDTRRWIMAKKKMSKEELELERLESFKRGQKSCFIEYWKLRPFHFEEIWSREFTVENASDAWDELYETN
jgi:hypothetical protein